MTSYLLKIQIIQETIHRKEKKHKLFKIYNKFKKCFKYVMKVVAVSSFKNSLLQSHLLNYFSLVLISFSYLEKERMTVIVCHILKT